MLEEECDKDQQTSRNGEISHKAQTEQQQCYVEDLRQQAVEGQSSVQKDPELDQIHNSQQIKDSRCLCLRSASSAFFSSMLPNFCILAFVVFVIKWNLLY